MLNMPAISAGKYLKQSTKPASAIVATCPSRLLGTANFKVLTAVVMMSCVSAM
jgi:hypothetical protein